MKQILALLLASLLLYTTISVKAVDQNEVNSAITASFQAVERAEKVGGNVSSEVGLLNQAITLVRNGSDDNLTEAIRICQEVSLKENILAEQNLATRNMGYYQATAIVIALLAVGLLINKYGSKLYLSIWKTIWGNCRIERT